MAKKEHRKRRLLNRRNKRKYLKKRSFELNKDLPKSEQWFQKIYSKDLNDQYNKPFCGFIPDVINKKYKYIIEIDGSIHLTKKVMAKDKKKDVRYNLSDYKVFRIEAFNDEQAKNVIEQINLIKLEYIKKQNSTFF